MQRLAPSHDPYWSEFSAYSRHECWLIEPSIIAVYADVHEFLFNGSRLFSEGYRFAWNDRFSTDEVFAEETHALMLLENGEERVVIIVDSEESPYIQLVFTDKMHRRSGLAKKALFALSEIRKTPLCEFYGEAVSEEGWDLLQSFSTSLKSSRNPCLDRSCEIAA